MIDLIKDIYFNELTIDDIELVRNWRNNPDVNKFFINKNYISKEQQEKWFNNINIETQKYFMASNSDDKIGLFYITNINKKKNSCEPNGFIGNVKYLNTPVAGYILIAFFDMVFNKLGFNLLEGKILVENKKFIHIHQELGAEITLDNKVVWTSLKKKEFENFKLKFL